MILKLGMKHQAMELYKVYISHDPGMTLTFFYSKVNLGRPCIHVISSLAQIGRLVF